MTTKKIEKIIELLKIVPKAPEHEIPEGLSAKEVLGAEQRIGISLPEELIKWLSISNGPCVGPGGIAGINPGKIGLDIEEHLARYRSWKKLGWIPIAGDGCGNFYVIDTKKKTTYGHPIYFIEAIIDPEIPDYVAASNIWSFLLFLLEEELGNHKWPFDKEYVIKKDPGIEECIDVAKPWEAD